jgi:hypothetical protein
VTLFQETWLLDTRWNIADSCSRRKRDMQILKVCAQELYITVVHSLLAKANYMATHEFNKVKTYICPEEKNTRKIEYLINSNTINHVITNLEIK